MASGLVALLDDVAAIAKIAATSLDDVVGAAGKAGSKAVGVVVDDAAVTPGFAMGFTPDRELPIVFKIAVGSLRNKFLFLLPGALLLSALAPFLITPILMLGGAYLCFEASEKILEAFTPEDEELEREELALSSAEIEDEKVQGAIRTDLILSAEIMAIALGQVSSSPLLIQAGALAVVGLLLTIGVYGVVGLIVKMDDIGLHFAHGRHEVTKRLGRALVQAMPLVMDTLSRVGTAAMLWVGGGIIVHGLEKFHLKAIPNLIEALTNLARLAPVFGGVASWLAFAAASTLIGLAVGWTLVGAKHLLPRRH
jgi:predicted DNA repair protein MutK